MKIKAISLHQPWASLVARRAKRIETRSWRCPLPPGSLLAIHAAKKWDEELHDLCYGEPFLSALRKMGCGEWLDDSIGVTRPPLPFGAIVCVVRLGECLSTADALLRPGLVTADEGHFGNYSPGRFAWILDAALSFAPVPERGRQSIWEWEVPERSRPAVELLS